MKECVIQKHNQDLHIHSEDVRDIVPVLKKEQAKSDS